MPECMHGALLVTEDQRHGYYLAWFGGHGIHVYDLCGQEVALWNTGDFSRAGASAKDIEKSMLDNMRTGDYINLIDWS